MPSRSSRSRSSSSSSAASPAAAPSSVHRSLSSHGTAITILWVVVLFFSIGVWLTLLVHTMRLQALEESARIMRSEFANARQALSPEMLAPSVIPLPPSAPALNPTPTSSAVIAAPTTTSGILDRGSMSPDGSKFAGYDSVTKGKIGIGVETFDPKRLRHIVIFNPSNESTGKGTAFESDMSVRWKDDRTIEYDILLKKAGEWVKEVQTVQIYF